MGGELQIHKCLEARNLVEGTRKLLEGREREAAEATSRGGGSMGGEVSRFHSAEVR